MSKIDLDKFLGDFREELCNRNLGFLIAVIDTALKQQHIGIYDGIVVKEDEQKPAESINDVYPETLDKAIDLYYFCYGNGNGGFDNLSLLNFRDIVHTFVNDYGNKQKESKEQTVIIKCGDEVDFETLSMTSKKSSSIKFDEESPQTLDEISKNGYVDMNRPIELTIQDEPDFERMEAEYCTTLDTPNGVLDAIVQSKMCSAYRKGLEDMYKRLSYKK